jgi:hypothetical protein
MKLKGREMRTRLTCVVATFDLAPLQHLQPGGPGVFRRTHIHVPCEGAPPWDGVPGVETRAELSRSLRGEGASQILLNLAREGERVFPGCLLTLA